MSTTVDLKSTYLAHQNLNSSPAKQYFSFPQEQRFNYGTKVYCNKPFYDLPDWKATRGAGLGKGYKSDFTKGDNRYKPSPQAYDLKTCFETNQNKSKGFSFNSRNNLKFGSFPNVSSTPGPGSYSIDKKNKTQAFSLGRRTADPQMMTTVRENPGPGAHTLEGLNKLGKYHFANFSGSCATRFNPPTSVRLRDYKNPNPGPGTYDQEHINQKCHYKDSKFKNPEGGRWAKGERSKKLKTSKVPGPGYYKTLSEFGSTEFPPMRRVKAGSTMSSPYAKSLQQTYSVQSKRSKGSQQQNYFASQQNKRQSSKQQLKSGTLETEPKEKQQQQESAFGPPKPADEGEQQQQSQENQEQQEQ